MDVRSSTPSGSKNKLFEMASRNSSFSSSKGSLHNNIIRGPQPLTKNIIGEDKMIQLRKKSLDFMEATRHRSLLDKELGLSSHGQYQSAVVEELDVKFKVGGGRRDSKPDQDDDFDGSRIPLNVDTPDFDDDCPFPPPHTTIDSNQQAQLNSPSTDNEEDTEHRCNYHGSADDELSPKSPKSPLSPSTLTRAHTFNYGDKPIMDDDEGAEETDEYNMERGGSLRLTRHSKRARGKVNDIFSSYSSSALLISSMSQDETPMPTSPPPPICVTSSTPPIQSQHMMVSVYPPDEPDNNNQQVQVEVHSSQPNTSMQRRRKAALVPPIITGAHLDPPPACPFHKSSLSPPRIGMDRDVSKSPKPIRRGISPTPSGDSMFESSPNPPMRKKKVSVAQIEATVVPPTPVNLQPPAHISLSRSSSYNTLRTHQDAFADNAFRSVMQISQDAIVCANSIGEIVFWSVGACKMFGYSPAEAAGNSLEVNKYTFVRSIRYVKWRDRSSLIYNLVT